MIRVKNTTDSLAHTRELFRTQKRAFYSRFGDGDIFLMMGRDAANHLVTPALKQEMLEAFEIDDPLYLKGLAVNHPVEKGMVRGLFAVFRANTEMSAFLENNFSTLDECFFENPVFLHYFGVFKPTVANEFLTELIRPKRKLFVGNIPKEKVEKLIGPIHYYVQTPARNAYATMDEWWPRVLQHVHDVEMIIPAAGHASRVINKRLWHLNIPIQSFDIGSLVDITDSRQTRKWIRLAGHRIERYILSPDHQLSGSEKIAYWKKEIKLKFYSAIKTLAS